MCVSSEVLTEYREVLARPKFAALDRRAVGSCYLLIESEAIRVIPSGRLSISPDPDDNRLYECAEAAQAEYLVTGNTKHFPRGHGKTAIVTPRQLWAILKTRRPAHNRSAPPEPVRQVCPPILPCYHGILPMQIEKVYEPQRFEPHWAQWWIDSGIFRAYCQARRARIFARHSAAQRHRLAAHGPHAGAHRDRCHRPLASHAAATTRSGCPAPTTPASPRRWWSSANSPKKASIAATWAARNSKSASGSGRRESGGTIKRQMVRLGASCDWSPRALHARPGPLPRRPRSLRPPLRKRPDLSRRVHGQLVPALPHRHLRSRSGARRDRGPPLAHPLPGERHAGPLS